METTKQLQSMNMRTGKTKALAKSAKSILLLLAMLVMGQAEAWADAVSLPYSYGFENYNLATDGWTTQNPSGKNSSEFAIAGDAKKTGSYGFRFSSYSSSGVNTQYLISPELNAPNGVELSFAYKASSTSTTGETFKVGYSTTDTNIASFTFGEEISCKSTSWTDYEGSFPAGTKYIAIYYYANYQYRLYVDDFAFTASATGPALAVADGANMVASGYSYNFGLATAGATKTFTLSNPGTESITINIAATNGFGVSPANTTIAAKEETTLTVTMADVTGAGTVTITPTTGDVDPFIINVSGTIRDPNKVYETLLTGSIPEDWTTSGGTWSWSTTNGASSSAWYESSNYRLITPKLTVAAGEKFLFDAQGTYSGYQGVIFEYSTDGTTWTASSASTTVSSDWQTFIINDIPAGSYFIAIHGWQVNIRNFYGGELPIEPKMVVTQPANLDFGVYDKDATAPTKTFTIANTGKATLNGISVSSGNAAFTVTGAPSSLAAGASQEVTITMSTASVGNLSSDIKVNATGMDEVAFTVTGTVLPTGLSVVDFNDNQLPARWENTGWTFSNGAAYAPYHSPAYVMTTPKVVVNAGDMFIVKGKIEYNSTSYHVTVKGLDSNDNDVYNKKLTNNVFNTTDYTAVLLTDVPATVEKLQFVGYYGYIDEIQGINYAADLVVTDSESAAQASGLTYDFGECAANASVTYNFANVGAGTINITNVTITGDGAAAYSTNWTESVAAPFDLTITRSYDAERASAAQAAVVTVTTTEGAFVINVTGTDKAANAPELAVSTNAIDFGKVTADAVETVTVTNNGTGSMTVNIASDSEDFVVSAATLTEIGAGESKTFTVTFKYGTSYGVKNGNITVTPTYDEDAAETITVTGKAKDPATWSEDFSANELPTGWDAGANWTIADGVAKGTWNSSASYLTTVPLSVSATTDELTFDYITTAGNVSIIIQMSKDGGEWTTCNATPAISTYMSNGTSGTATITGLEAGSYQFRFKNDDYNLDNFEGFILNLPDHMASISAYTIPASTSYTITMKEGQSFDATVTVKEQRGVAEALTAKLYMGDNVIGTATGNVAAKGTEMLTITATPTTSAPSGAEMHIEVEYAGGTLSTENVTRYVAAITYLTLDETSSDAVVAGTYDNVTLKRKFNAGWNTVCLPFTISDVEEFLGTGAKAYNFTSYTDGALGFTSVTTLTASYPYIVYVPAAITEDIALTDITIASGDASAWYRYQSGAYFRGTYAPIAAGDWTKNADTDNIYGVTSEGKIAKAGASATMKGFRAYFDLPAGVTAPSLSVQDQTTGITTIVSEGSQQNREVYNLNGQKVNTPSKGLYIINGRKVVVK